MSLGNVGRYVQLYRALLPGYGKAGARKVLQNVFRLGDNSMKKIGRSRPALRRGARQRQRPRGR